MGANPVMKFPNGLERAVTLSYDDGVQQDRRFMEIIDRHGLKCTFNINSGEFAPEGKVYPEGTIHRRMSKSECLELYKNSGHEVAVHALTHPRLELMTQPAVTYEIVEDRKNLEQLFGGVIRGMAYPFGTYNDMVVDTLKTCGIAYARTTKLTNSFDIPTDWLRLDPTCKHCDPALPELEQLIDKFLGDRLFESRPWLFYMWGHTYEFERDNNWEDIEIIAERLGGKDNVWYATNIEVYDYVEAYRSLLWSADSNRVYNPSAKKIWFSRGKKLYSVEPGETLDIN